MEEYNTLYDLNAIDIQTYQKNRYPMLFIDYVTEAKPGEYARGFKNFSYNEWYFPVHFDDEPNVPAFVQIEGLTQMFLMTFLTIPEYKGMKTGFVSIDGAKFKRKIEPGERLDIEATLDSFKRGVAKGHVESYVNGEVACTIKLTITIPDVLKKYRPA
ncbi:MAG: beta-hydroxyacyl-ACP dehydratase [Eubacterium sp.]|nr:beta-hydroxyacyl-ACP dehydratase [Eubacterium sp.]